MGQARPAGSDRNELLDLDPRGQRVPVSERRRLLAGEQLARPGARVLDHQLEPLEIADRAWLEREHLDPVHLSGHW